MKIDFSKFLSRKFLVAIVGMIVGLAIALGADSSEIMQVAGAITSVISAVSYIFGEAKVDAAAVTQTVILTTEENYDEDEDEFEED